MRNHIIDEITKLAEQDDRIIILTGDLGFGVLEKFAGKFPNRFVNIGIAEQNLASVAAGLALEGNLVFMYSIGNFPTMRCLEQIRNDICYHNTNVKILALGGGFAYGKLGMSHHATEDISMMRSLPNMRVFVPSDIPEALACLKDVCNHNGPDFIRIAKGKEPDLHSDTELIDVSKLVNIKKQGKDINILTCGTVLSEGIELQNLFSRKDYDTGLYSVPSIKPIDAESIKQLAKSSKLLITMEDHNIVGGLGSSVAEILSGLSEHAVLYRSGLNETYTYVVGDQDYIREFYNLSSDKVFKIIMEKYYHILNS